MSRRALFGALALVGCGSSSEPFAPARGEIAPVADAGEPPAPTPKRTMKSVGLFGDTSIHNLLIDHTFDVGNPGIGRWYSNLGTGLTGNGPDVQPVITASSPAGMSLSVGAVSDVPDSGSPRTFTLLAQVPGGTGPYVVSLWLTTERGLVGEIPSQVRVSLATATGVGLTGAEVLPDDASARVIDGRTWVRYHGEVAGSPTLGAYLVIRFKGSRNRWWLQAEVVPKSLLDGASTRSLRVALPRTLDDEERAAITAYRRVPLDLGLGRPR